MNEAEAIWQELVGELQRAMERSRRLCRETAVVLASSEVLCTQSQLVRQRAALIRQQSRLERRS